MRVLLIALLLLAADPRAQFAYPPKAKHHVAVFPVDFPETPAEVRSAFPNADLWRKTLFEERIKAYLDTISYGRFKFTGDVFEYTRSPVTMWDGGNPKEADLIVASLNITAPGYDAKKYDKVVFILCYDARLGGSRSGLFKFRINGQSYSQGADVIFHQKGRYNRESGRPVTDMLAERNQYMIPVPPGKTEEGDVWSEMSRFEHTFLHELIHGLGIGAHAKSRTNDGRADWEPQAPNNQQFWDEDYGNNYDIMGHGEFANSLNGGFRDIIGLMDTGMIASVSAYGTRRITVNPLNSKVGKRYIEVLLPGQKNPYGAFKNNGYGLEIRTAGHWDSTLNHPQLRGNLDGFFVMKSDGLSNFLLDMSPSPNLAFSWGIKNDIRDVVLKPGMAYENKEVRFSNVARNADGSFSVDIQIKSVLGAGRHGQAPGSRDWSFPSMAASGLAVPKHAAAAVLGADGRVLGRHAPGSGYIPLGHLGPGIYWLRLGEFAPFTLHRFMKTNH
jgi:hypothetical protein